MTRRQIACIFLTLCAMLWTASYLEFGLFSEKIDEDRARFLKRILPFYSNITPESRLSPLEDAKFNEQTGKLVAYLRTFEEPFFFPVPKSWCVPSSQNNWTVTYRKRQLQIGSHSKASMDTVVARCFDDKDPNATNRTKLRHSLRLLRRSFDESNVTLIMTFGSALGSLRYHKRMFYDVDYDFFVNSGDMETAVGILGKLSANTSNEMRFIDARPAYGLLKFGFLCGSEPGWRQQNKCCVEISGSYVVCKSAEATKELLRPCGFYGDFYWIRKGNPGTIQASSIKTVFVLEDVLHSDYRPLDGTLWRYVRHFNRYAEMIYGSSSKMCVPKTGIRVANEELSKLTGEKSLICKYFEVPCTYVDEHHPQVHILTVGKNRIELGLRWLKSGKCAAYSLFVKFR